MQTYLFSMLTVLPIISIILAGVCLHYYSKLSKEQREDVVISFSFVVLLLGLSVVLFLFPTYRFVDMVITLYKERKQGLF
tara:strand:+ start:93 stop:332 length:240 start_codon:yes stop_codon:yes gene_type:complete